MASRWLLGVSCWVVLAGCTMPPATKPLPMVTKPPLVAAPAMPAARNPLCTADLVIQFSATMDTQDTIAAIQRHNTAWQTFCGGGVR
jgi:hypothetical protein